MVLPRTTENRQLSGSTSSQGAACRRRGRSRTSPRSGASAWCCTGAAWRTPRVRPDERREVRRQLEQHALAATGDELVGRVEDELRSRRHGRRSARSTSSSPRPANSVRGTTWRSEVRAWRASSQGPHLATKRARLISEMLCSLQPAVGRRLALDVDDAGGRVDHDLPAPGPELQAQVGVLVVRRLPFEAEAADLEKVGPPHHEAGGGAEVDRARRVVVVRAPDGALADLHHVAGRERDAAHLLDPAVRVEEHRARPRRRRDRSAWSSRGPRSNRAARRRRC